jgi:hypothetical protein
MATLHRSNQTPTSAPLQMLVYDRALHPGTFELRSRRPLHSAEFVFEALLLRGLHMLRFTRACQQSSVTELLTNQPNVPREMLSAFPLVGEREVNHELQGKIRYMTNVSTEILPAIQFEECRREIDESIGTAPRALRDAWDDGAGECLSVIDMQPAQRSIQVDCFHFIATGNIVIRSQSLFELG